MVPAPLMPGGGRMGAGSPVGSERSEGQRWGGQQQQQGHQHHQQQQGQQQGRRNVLDGNADFALPGGRM